MSRNPSLVYLYSDYVSFLYFCPFSKRCTAYVKWLVEDPVYGFVVYIVGAGKKKSGITTKQC